MRISLKGRRIDFAGRDAANRRLGVIGEEFALWYERGRLLAAGRDDLASKVRWVARDIGDGLGFDILSFDEADGSELYVEVKATADEAKACFEVTAAEWDCARLNGPRYRIFRVHNAGRPDARIEVICDPYKLWQEGRLVARPVRIEL